MDPIQDEMPTWSAYNYGFCNPVIFNDPSGNSPEEEEKGKILPVNEQGYPEDTLSEVNVTAKRGPSVFNTPTAKSLLNSSSDYRWLNISEAKIDRYQYSEEGFSDPMNYVRFIDNVGFAVWNSAVDITDAIANFENTLKSTSDYLSNTWNYWTRTSLTQQWKDTEEQIVNAATNIQTYENIGAGLLTTYWMKPYNVSSLLY